MRGPNAAHYVNGRSTKARHKLSKELAAWRSAVFVRDGWRCCKCESNDDIQAHHIKHFATHPELRLDVDNGITLCIDCHSKEHGRDLRRGKPKKLCQDCQQRIDPRAKRCKSCHAKRLHKEGVLTRWR